MEVLDIVAIALAYFSFAMILEQMIEKIVKAIINRKDKNDKGDDND